MVYLDRSYKKNKKDDFEVFGKRPTCIKIYFPHLD